MMRKFLISVAILTAAAYAQASWYWPFDSDEDGPDKPRLSELMEPATTNIDAAADFAAEGKVKEAQDCYRAAIAALNKIELENPERAATPEFATVRNKRAYINAALDAMLLAEARDNAKAVAVTDTTELEMKMVLRPWNEFQPTYEALTNADRLISKRLAFVGSDWAHELLNAVTDPGLQVTCVSNCNALAKRSTAYAANRDGLHKAYAEARTAVARMEKCSESAAGKGGMRFFDVSKQDARKAIGACKNAWPKLAKAMHDLNNTLDGLRDALADVCARKDLPQIAGHYTEKIKGRDMEYVEDLVRDMGHFRACEEMLGELNAVQSGVVHRGALYRLFFKWGGGEEPDVPAVEKEDGRKLVKDDGDSRPKVESQIDTYMEEERKNTEQVKRRAGKAKAKKDVQKEIKKLLEEDPKSRKARLLMAGEDLRNGDTAAAKAKVSELLKENPNDGSALNMRAAIEATEGDLKAAERTLDLAIQSNPRDYHAYYNMANVYLQKGNVDGARRFYETGRSFAGPENKDLEKAVMPK